MSKTPTEPSNIQPGAPTVRNGSAPLRPTGRLKSILCLDDFEGAARKHLPRPIFEYIAGAAETNSSLTANRESFDDYAFIPRVMVDISKRSSAVTVFGKTYASPIGISPLGLSALSAYRGDIVLARAAANSNVPMIMSGSSLIRLEEVAAAAPGTWFQAYLPGDVPAIEALIDRIANAGFETLAISTEWSAVETMVTPESSSQVTHNSLPSAVIAM
ncbi:MAG: alpha-hydroxy-acid oxidizing protein, partial [Acidobacteriota bacterium]